MAGKELPTPATGTGRDGLSILYNRDWGEYHNITTMTIGGDDDANKKKPVYTKWHGYDVVLTGTKHPSATNLTQLATATASDDSAAATGVAQRRSRRKMSSGDSLRYSMRRTSTGKDSNDYGWIRQLELRDEVPSIDEIRAWSFDILVFKDSVLIGVFIKMLEYYDLLNKLGLSKSNLERYCKEVMDMHHKDCYYQKVDIEKEKKDKSGSDCNGEQGDGGDCWEQGVEIDEEEKFQPEILCEYHNWYHAVSCAHVCFLFMTLGGADAFLYPVEIFCIIMAALIHDLDHPGTNNDFEVKRKSSLARLYDNDAVLERHSINMGLNMCVDNSDLDWLKSFESEEDRDYVKHFIAESVLATDPARHGGVLKQALAILEQGKKDYSSNWNADPPTSITEPVDTQMSPTYFDRGNPEHRVFIGMLLVHSADISNPLHQSFEVASDWAIRVTTEFSRQANKERELQLPVTTFMDGLDSQVKIAKLQIGFFDWMVKPLYNTLGILFEPLKPLEGWGKRNCDGYQKVIDAHNVAIKQQEAEQKMQEEKQQDVDVLDDRGEQTNGAMDEKEVGVEQAPIEGNGDKRTRRGSIPTYAKGNSGGDAPF